MSPSSSVRRRIWACWFTFCACLLTVVLIRPEYQPYVGQDEVQLIEFGRVTLDPDTSWGMNWNFTNDEPLALITWPGVIAQELGWRVTRSVVAGPRLVALLFAILAGSAILGWLLERQVPGKAALAISAAFLLDPMYADSYLGGRIDGAAIAACLACCWVLWRNVGQRSQLKPVAMRWLAAGSLAAVGFFTWPTAVLLTPLIIVEWLKATYRQSHLCGRSFRELLISSAAWIAAGVASTLILLTIPILPHLELYQESLTQLAVIQQRASTIQSSIVSLLIAHTPMMTLFAVTSLLWRRSWSYLLAAGVAVILMQQTMIYPARLIYLIPYMVAIIAAASSTANQSNGLQVGPRAFRLMLVVLTAWNIVVTGLGPLRNQPNRQMAADHVDRVTLLREAVGDGTWRVLLDDWSTYYAARVLAWQIYRPGAPVGGPEFAEFLKEVDYVVVRHPALYDTTRQFATKAGFVLSDTIELPTSVGGQNKYTLEIYRHPRLKGNVPNPIP